MVTRVKLGLFALPRQPQVTNAERTIMMIGARQEQEQADCWKNHAVATEKRTRDALKTG